MRKTPLRLAGIALLSVVLVVFAALLVLGAPRSASSSPQLAGTLLPGTPAPNFHLRDQLGRAVSMNQQRGKVTILTFFYTHCPDTCPVTAEKLRGVVRKLGSAANRVSVIAVTTDPWHDTPALARAWLQQHGLVRPWHFLLGKPTQVAPVWLAYHVYAATGAQGPTHTAGMYLIDPQGRERVYLDDTDPAAEITNDLNALLDDHRPALAVAAPVVGAPAPNFSLPSLQGSSLGVSAWKGKVVALNFWATWCRPCRAELPMLEQTYRQDAARGLVIVGVDREDGRQAVQDFVTPRHITYPIVLDGEGAVGDLYDIYGTPTTIVIDRQGVIRYIHVGALTAQGLARLVNPLLAGGKAA